MSSSTKDFRVHRPALFWAPLLAVAVIRFVLPMASTLLAPIGFTADEFYYLACADQLDWGYVDHPPFSIALLAALRSLFGDSMLAVRFVPALCESLAVIVTGALAREFGGGRPAQLVAALAMASAPIALAIGLPYSMNPLEHLLWPLAILVIARLQNDADAKWWLVLGLLLGIALQNKLSTAWLGAGLAVGFVVSPARIWLRTPWPWLAGALSVSIIAPHVAWQAANDWPTLEFVRNNAAAREGLDADVLMQSPVAFVVSQLLVMGPFCAPIWLAGLVHLLRAPALRRHRVLGWTFAAVFVLLTFSGRSSIYYLVGIFPIVLAAGGVAIEQLASRGRRRLPAIACTALVLQALLLTPVLVPLVGVERYLELARGARRQLGVNAEAASLPPIYQWMLGGREVSEAVARVTSTLSESEHRKVGVLATTFGEAGALVHFGRKAGMPPVIGTHNNFWLWGTRGLDGSVMIVVASPGDPILGSFASCQSSGRVDCPHCDPGLQGREIYLCRDPVRPLPSLWAALKKFD